MEADLLVIEKMQALLVWTLNHIATFPRSHRYGIARRFQLKGNLIGGVLAVDSGR